jgi:hypothetical protein
MAKVETEDEEEHWLESWRRPGASWRVGEVHARKQDPISVQKTILILILMIMESSYHGNQIISVMFGADADPSWSDR